MITHKYFHVYNLNFYLALSIPILTAPPLPRFLPRVSTRTLQERAVEILACQGVGEKVDKKVTVLIAGKETSGSYLITAKLFHIVEAHSRGAIFRAVIDYDNL